VNNLIKEEFFREYSTSSNIAKIEYDDDTFEMDITFQNGAVYKYFYVPTYEFDRFISSESHGLNSSFIFFSFSHISYFSHIS
jgi:hypothetical protein